MPTDPRAQILIVSPTGNPADDKVIDQDADLLADLEDAEGANQHARPCQVCEALSSMSDQAKSGVLRALAGTIGEERLAAILTRNGYPTGRRAVKRHRREDHTP